MPTRSLSWLVVLLVAMPALAADQWTTMNSEHGLPSDEIQVLAEGSDGSLWIGTYDGLARWHDNKVDVLIGKGQIWEVVPAADGEVWIGTAKGISSVKDGTVTEVYEGGIVGTIMPGGDKPSYAISLNRGTEVKTLITNASGSWEAVDHFKKEHVLEVKHAADGTLWVAIEGKGVVNYDPSGEKDPAIYLEGASVSTMTFDSKGRLWVGTWGGGVHVNTNGTWSRHLAKEKAQIWAVREDRKGNIWVSTDQNGLWRYDGDTWAHDLAKEGGVNLLETTSDGRVWISTQHQGGLRYWDGKQWVTSLASPFPIAKLIETKAGRIVAGGVLDGVHVLKK